VESGQLQDNTDGAAYRSGLCGTQETGIPAFEGDDGNRFFARHLT